MEVFTIRMTSAFFVMIVPFINLHTKLTVQVIIYFIYVAGHSRVILNFEPSSLEPSSLAILVLRIRIK